MNRRGASMVAAARHFSPVGKPDPPRPRSPDAAMVAIVAVGPSSAIALRRPENAPAAVAASRFVGSVVEALAIALARRSDGQRFPPRAGLGAARMSVTVRPAS